MTGSVFENPVRRQIVTFIGDGELSAGDIATLLGRPRPGVSHHLSALVEHGIVERRLQGAFRYYRLVPSRTFRAWDAYLAALAPEVARATEDAQSASFASR